MEGRLDFCCLSDVGRSREENEDNHGELSCEDTRAGWLFIVADGMGGAAAGKMASQMAVDVGLAEYRAHVARSGQEDVFESIRHAVTRANEAIYQKSRADRDCYGMGTTITVLVVRGDQAYTAHVGDSRIYRFRDGRLEKLMRDHTRVQVLTDQGIITPGEANDHPEGHVINRNLGGQPNLEVDTPEDGPFQILDGDVFLLCSDGLHGLVGDDAIRRILAMAPPQHATPALIKLANLLGGYDNITVSVVCAGEPYEAWSHFQEDELDALVDELALEGEASDQVFTPIDDGELAPSDFDTNRLEALERGDDPDAAKSVASAQARSGKRNASQSGLQNTLMLDSPFHKPGGVASPEVSSSASRPGSPSPASPTPGNPVPWGLIVVLLGVIVALLIALVGVFLWLQNTPAGEGGSSPAETGHLLPRLTPS